MRRAARALAGALLAAGLASCTILVSEAIEPAAFEPVPAGERPVLALAVQQRAPFYTHLGYNPNSYTTQSLSEDHGYAGMWLVPGLVERVQFVPLQDAWDGTPASEEQVRAGFRASGADVCVSATYAYDLGWNEGALLWHMLTLGLFPLWGQGDLALRARFQSPGGTLLGELTRTVHVRRYRHWLLLPAAPFLGDWPELERDTWPALTRSILAEAQQRGWLRR